CNHCKGCETKWYLNNRASRFRPRFGYSVSRRRRSLPMTRLLVVLFTAAVAVAEPPKTHQIKLDGQTFTLPEGFTIERVAGPPLVDRPISASFDDRGRLYVTDSSGSNEKLTEQLKHPNHRVIRLEDTKGTGTFDKSTVFA